MNPGLARTLVGTGLLLVLSGALGAQDPPPPAKGGPDDTAELLLFLVPGTDPTAYAREHGLALKQTLRSNPDAHVFAAADGLRAKAHRGAAGADRRVRRAYLNQKLQRVKCAWVPNDEYYLNGTPPGFPGQWHLGNGAVPGVNIKVPAVWNNDITGLGVTVGVVDDGLQITHEDLAPNYVAADSWDFGQNDGNPSPVNGGQNEDRHGTSVAGVAAARGGNLVGGTGAAPHAGLAGLRIDFPAQTTAMFVDATQYHSSAASLPLSIKIKNHSYGYSAPFIESQAERDAVAFSTASGTIHLFAAGNERGAAGQDSNKQDVQSSPDVIAVAALGSDARFSYYSSFGSNVFVTAPSSGITGFGITTTDRTGGDGYNRNPGDGDTFPDLDYTSTFGGTSSATPLAAGVMALVKQVQPALDLRFAKHLLAITSQQVDPTDNTTAGGGNGSTAGSAWKTNAAGRKFNQNYGFGLIDAQALTQQAVLYSGVTSLQTASVGSTAVGAAIPDNNLTGVTRTFPIAATAPLEEILITLNITHPYRGDLEAYLTSPAGTQCRLFSTVNDNGDNILWTFASNAFWGENPAGTWTLLVRDIFNLDVGTWNSFAVTARMGQLVLNATPPTVTSVSRAGANPTAAAAVDFSVAFSENVTGVNAADFALTTTGGISGASVGGVSGSGSLYTVTVNTGSGDGTIRLDVLDDNSIQDASSNPLNGAFNVGQAYTVDKSAPGVVRVTSTTSNGTYAIGASINLSVDFTEPVTLAGGNLQVTLDTGDVLSITPFALSSSAAVNYVVGTGDNSADLNSTLLSLPAGTLRDAAGNACALTIPGGQNLAALKALVVDTTAPQVVSVNSSSLDGAYGSGASINVTVTFTEALTLLGGNLQVTLGTGDLVSIPPFASSTTASGTYVVGAGDNAADLDSTLLSLSAGTLRDAAGNACNLAIPGGQSLAALEALVVDTTSPTATVNQAGVQADPTNLGPILFTAVFSEPVSGLAPGDVSFTGSTAGGALAASVSGSETTYTISVGGMTSTGLVRVSLPAAGAVDAAGNGNAASTSSDNTVTYDVTAPTVTLNQAGGQGDPTNVSPILFSVVFSKAVTGFATGDVLLGGTAGATTASVTGSGTTYTVTVGGMTSDGSVTATIPAAVALDAAGNGNFASTSTDNAVAYDVTPPSVAINQAAGQSDPTNAGPIQFTAVFSESVSGFGAGDVSLAGSTVGGTLVVNVSGAGTTYTVSVTGMTGTGTVVASIPAAAALDGVGNSNTASTSADAVVVFNAGVPTVTINKAGGQADPTAVASIVYSVVFSESVTGFAAGDLSFAGSTAGGTLGALLSGSGAAYTVTVTGMTSSGAVVVSIPAGAAINAATTANAASTSADNSVAYDITPPTVTINQAGGQADPSNASPLVFTVAFSEAVTGFTNADLVLAGATTALVTGSGATYSVSVSGMPGSGTVSASIAAGAANDAAGNSSAASTSSDNTVSYDVTPPTVTINQTGGQSDPTSASPILFSVVFSEAVTGFTNSDVVLGGATTAIVSGSGATYSVSVSGMPGSGAVSASIAAGAALDAAGNSSAASTSTDNTVTYDVTAPTVTINQAGGQADPTNAASIFFTVVFSEAVGGFTNTDVVLGGATTALVSGGPVTYTVTVTGMTVPGAVSASIVFAAAQDVAGNPSLGSTSTDNSVFFDNTAPSVTINQDAVQADPTNASPILFTVVFSEAVTGFAGDDVLLGGTAGATTALVSGSGTTYSVSVSGMSTSGTVSASVVAGAALDAAGNSSAASTSSDNTVSYDVTAPTVTINQNAVQADPTNAASILFSVVFSEPVTGFTNGDVVLGGTAGATTAMVSGGPTTYSVAVTGMTVSGKVTAALAAGAALDEAGNSSEAATSTDNAVTYDVSPPSVTINQAAGQPDPTNAGPILFTVEFSEPVGGFTDADVLLAGASVAVVSGGPASYTVSVTGMSGATTVSASVVAGAALDEAGNSSAASTSTDASVAFDGVAPTVTINQAAGQPDPSMGPSILFSVVFSEAVSGFGNADVVLGGASTALVSGGPAVYAVTVSGFAADGPVTASLAAGAALDAAGNASAASTSLDNSVLFDGTPPTVTVNQALGQADPAGAAPILFTAVFSEPVSGFTATDLVTSGTAIVSGGPTTFDISVSAIPADGPVSVTIAAGAATDAAGNASAASTGVDNTVLLDTTPPAAGSLGSPAADGSYGPGALLQVSVAFSEAVFVTGTPRLTLETGAADVAADYVSGGGSSTLTFAFTVAAGHESADLDVPSTAALALNGGTIRDAAGHDALLTLAAPGAPGSLGAARAIVVDGTPPLAGAVDDGWSGPDLDVQLSATTLSAHWSGFSDAQSGLAGFEWCIGSSPGGAEIRAFAPVGLQTAASTSAVDVLLALSTGTTYYVTVRATNGTGLSSTAVSDGVLMTGADLAGPGAPASFYATGADQAALLDWSPSADAAFYRIWRKPAAAPWTDAVLVDALIGTTTIIGGLANGTLYDFRLKAVDANGNESPGLVASALPQAAITIGGLGTYATVADALAAAVAGDTVWLGPGTYPGPLTLPPGVSIAGASPVHTTVTGGLTVQGTYLTDPVSTIRDLTITGGTVGVDGGAADVLLDHLLIHHVGGHGATSLAAGRLRALTCTVMSNGGDGLRALGVASARNCIAGKNAGTGLNLPAAASATYNDVYGNAIDFAAGLGGLGNLTAAAVFADEALFDYRELGSSPSVDAGDAADVFAQEPSPNGGRINIGVFGNTRWAASLYAPAPSGGGGGGGGGCGLTGLEFLAWVVAWRLRRRRNPRT